MSPGLYSELCYYIQYSTRTLQLTAGSMTCCCFSWWCQDESLNLQELFKGHCSRFITSLLLFHEMLPLKALFGWISDRWFRGPQNCPVLFFIVLYKPRITPFFSSHSQLAAIKRGNDHFMLKTIWVNASRIHKKNIKCLCFTLQGNDIVLVAPKAVN